jgi:ABC-type bacteriocin/lantibiotic exporter with double-glycine peptidase domain
MHAPEPPEALAACVGHLAGLVGVPVDTRRLRDACERASSIPGHGESARFERLAAAAGDCGLRVVPVRMAIADVLWRAGAGSPFAAIGTDGGWMIVSGRGFFRGRIIDPATGGDPRPASREEIARRLGIPDVNAARDFAVVQSATPVSAPDVVAGHGGDHGHPGPHRRLWALLHPEMADVRAIVGFSVITGILYLAVPLTVDAVVNNIAFGGQQRVYVQALLVLSVALLAVLALLAMVRAAQHHLAEVIQRRIFVRLSADLAHRLPRVAAAETDRVHAPEMVNRFFDVVTVQKSSSLLLLDGVNLVLSAVIGMGVLAFYHPSLLAFVFVLLALICLVVFGLGRGAVRTSIEESKAKYAVAGWLEELAVFPNLFKGPGGARFAMDRADALLRRYLDSRRAHFRVLMRQIGGLLALQALASSALLAVGGFLVLSGELTLGQLVASEIIVTAVVASVAKLGKHLEGWYDAMAAMDKIGHLVDLETERESGERAVGGEHGARLEARNVSFAYPGGKEVLGDVTFTVEPGARVALVGPAGAGTSTLLDLVYGLRTAHAGHASVDGLDLRQWSLAELRNVVSLVRGHDIVDASVADNVGLARPGIGMDEVRAALGDVGLLDDVLAMPAGFDSPILLGGRPLTGLQRTRLVVARAIVGKPRLLLLDGTLDGLAAGDLEALASVLFDASRPWTAVVATRDPDVIRKCNAVIRLGGDAGRVAGSTAAN